MSLMRIQHITNLTDAHARTMRGDSSHRVQLGTRGHLAPGRMNERTFTPLLLYQPQHVFPPESFCFTVYISFR